MEEMRLGSEGQRENIKDNKNDFHLIYCDFNI